MRKKLHDMKNMYIFVVSNTIKVSVYPLGNTVYIA